MGIALIEGAQQGPPVLSSSNLATGPIHSLRCSIEGQCDESSTAWEQATKVTIEPEKQSFICARNSAHESAEDRSTDAFPTLRPLFWLRTSVLVSLFLLFTACWVFLIVLWKYSSLHHGLALTISSNHYAWTYGPTAILLIVVILWRQVDYHCKLIQPWRELSVGPVNAERSVLLDYISPIQIVSFFRALSYKHFPVAASILGFVLLKLVILVSTALLTISTVNHAATAEILYTSRFNSTPVWEKVSLNPLVSDEGNESSRSIFSGASMKPIWFAATIGNEQFSDPNLYDGTVSESFNITKQPHDIVAPITAPVQVFVPDVTCTEATAVFGPYCSDIWIQSQTCSPRNHFRLPINLCDTGNSSSPMSFAQYYRLSCSTHTSSNTTNPPSITLSNPADYDFHYVVVMSNVVFEKTKAYRDPHASWMTATICKVAYHMETGVMTHYRSTNTTKTDNTTVKLPGSLNKETQLPDLDTFRFGELVFSTLASAGKDFLKELIFRDVEASDAAKCFFRLMMHYSPANLSFPLLDDKSFPESVATTLSRVSLGIGHDVLLQTIERASLGDTRVDEPRLFIRPISLWLMIVGFFVLSLLTLVLLLTIRNTRAPQELGSIGSYAVSLLKSPSITETINKLGQSRSSYLKWVFRYVRFSSTSPQHPFHIRMHSHHQEPPFLARRKTYRVRPWVPMVAKSPIVILTFSIPLATIVGLEITQRVSDTKGGLITLMTNDTDVSSYALRYGVSLVMLLAATMINNLDFVISVFAPFSALRSGEVSAERSILFHLIGQTPIVSFYQSIRYRHLSAMCSIVATGLGAVLTIIVSGLFVQSDVLAPTSTGINGFIYDWDPNWSTNAASDSGAAMRLNAIQHSSSDVTKIPNTTGDSVFPRISYTSTEEQDLTPFSPSDQSFSFDIPALQPELSCNAFSLICSIKRAAENNICSMSNDIAAACHNGTYYNGSYYSSEAIECRINPPLDFLSRRNASGEAQHGIVPEILDHLDLFQDSTFYGNLVDLSGALWAETISSEKDVRLNQSYSFPIIDYPSLGFIFGRNANLSQGSMLQQHESVRTSREIPSVSFGNELPTTNHSAISSVLPKLGEVPRSTSPYVSNFEITVLLCYQRVRSTSYYVTYAGLPSHNEIDFGSPPLLLKNETSYLVNGENGKENFAFKVKAFVEPFLMPFNVTDQRLSLDSFFHHVIYGPDGVDPEHLHGLKNLENLTRAVTMLYNKYMVQVIDLNFRSPELKREVYGSLNVMTPRLIVDPISKLTLQIMLACMTILSAIAFFSVDLRGTLPRDPCSIASVMGLLVDSRMCDPRTGVFPEDAEFMTRKELKKALSEWRFSLGWWEKEAAANKQGDDESSRASRTSRGTGTTSRTLVSKRFGIDVGRPVKAGYRETRSFAFWRRMRRRDSSATPYVPI